MKQSVQKCFFHLLRAEHYMESIWLSDSSCQPLAVLADLLQPQGIIYAMVEDRYCAVGGPWHTDHLWWLIPSFQCYVECPNLLITRTYNMFRCIHARVCNLLCRMIASPVIVSWPRCCACINMRNHCRRLLSWITLWLGTDILCNVMWTNVFINCHP